jgi:hypothetical protein
VERGVQLLAGRVELGSLNRFSRERMPALQTPAFAFSGHAMMSA